jgi:mannose-6-phosphate isomerase-like protein (cupin superfamily)
MRRQSFLIASLCLLSFAAGGMISHIGVVAAQGRGQQTTGQAQANQGIRAVQPPTRAEHGKALYFPINEIKAKFVANRQTELSATHLAWDPSYRFTVMTRAYYDPPRLGRVSQEMIHWDDAEMHENKTQIYIMVDGTGIVALGGEPAKDRASADGQHSGGPLKGATLQRVSAGDWVVIPPYTWHQAQPDEGQTMVYGMCHIETRNTMP